MSSASCTSRTQVIECSGSSMRRSAEPTATSSSMTSRRAGDVPSGALAGSEAEGGTTLARAVAAGNRIRTCVPRVEPSTLISPPRPSTTLRQSGRLRARKLPSRGVAKGSSARDSSPGCRGRTLSSISTMTLFSSLKSEISTRPPPSSGSDCAACANRFKNTCSSRPRLASTGGASPSRVTSSPRCRISLPNSSRAASSTPRTSTAPRLSSSMRESERIRRTTSAMR